MPVRRRCLPFLRVLSFVLPVEVYILLFLLLLFDWRLIFDLSPYNINLFSLVLLFTVVSLFLPSKIIFNPFLWVLFCFSSRVGKVLGCRFDCSDLKWFFPDWRSTVNSFRWFNLITVFCVRVRFISVCWRMSEIGSRIWNGSRLLCFRPGERLVGLSICFRFEAGSRGRSLDIPGAGWCRRNGNNVRRLGKIVIWSVLRDRWSRKGFQTIFVRQTNGFLGFTPFSLQM